MACRAASATLRGVHEPPLTLLAAAAIAAVGLVVYGVLAMFVLAS